MILFLIKTIENYGIKIPAVFGYTSTRMILAALTALLFCIFVGPYFIRKLYELKIGQTIRKEECPLLGKLHAKKQDTPTMGGILILFSMFIAWVLWIDLSAAFSWILLFVTTIVGLMGGRDDYLKLKYKNTKGLRAKKKLLIQALVAGFVGLYLLFPPFTQLFEQLTHLKTPFIKIHETLSLQQFYEYLYIPFFKEPFHLFTGLGVIFVFLFILFVIVGSSNAVNLTDGLDGLAAGCLIMVASGFALLAFISNNTDIARYLNIPYIETSGEIAVYLCSFVGASLGFLWYNSHPAQVFMGDIGSLALGATIGVSAVLLNRPLLLGLMGGVFVMEALSVILQVGSYRLRNKRRIFLCAPLHHHFEYQGIPETKVVIRFWIIGLLLTLIGIASLKFQ